MRKTRWQFTTSAVLIGCCFQLSEVWGLNNKMLNWWLLSQLLASYGKLFQILFKYPKLTVPSRKDAFVYDHICRTAAPCCCNVIVRVVFAGPLSNFLSFSSAILRTPKKVKLQEFIMMINPKTHTFPNLLRGSCSKPQVAGYWQEAADGAPSGAWSAVPLPSYFHTIQHVAPPNIIHRDLSLDMHHWSALWGGTKSILKSILIKVCSTKLVNKQHLPIAKSCAVG